MSFLPSEISRFVHFIVVVLGMPSAVRGAWGQTQDLTCKAPALPPSSIHSLKYSFISRGCFWTVASIYPRTAGLNCIFLAARTLFGAFKEELGLGRHTSFFPHGPNAGRPAFWDSSIKLKNQAQPRKSKILTDLHSLPPFVLFLYICLKTLTVEGLFYLKTVFLGWV